MSTPESTSEPIARTIYCVETPQIFDSFNRHKAIGLEVIPPLAPTDAERLANILSGKEKGFTGVVRNMVVTSNGAESTSFIAERSDNNSAFNEPLMDPVSLGVALQTLISPAHVENILVVKGAAQSVPDTQR